VDISPAHKAVNEQQPPRTRTQDLQHDLPESQTHTHTHTIGHGGLKLGPQYRAKHLFLHIIKIQD
jgi:hypothetical protein